MKITHQSASRTFSDPCLIAPHHESFHLDRDGAAYVQFDSQMTAQFQELEARFSQYLTPKAKRENLGRR
jgi:streptogramin lyase